ncbi:MAG: recombination mediator RecR [Candidatus Gracilibacteria bacterium]|nr:recombination mediator RecR [Candidatus Gracilibacteria bacterium]
MPDILKKLAELIGFLPGIGEKTAVKLAFFLLKSHPSYLKKLSETLAELQDTVHECATCGSLTDKQHVECEICRNPLRKTEVLCVVEDYLDLVSIERLGVHHGRYHVLGGVISPISGTSPSDLHLKQLFQRIESEEIDELILALNPNIEGEATALYIDEYNPKKGLKISRLSKGLPNAGFIEYADEITLLSAFRGRK